jgi:hypothetical protein
VDKADFTEMDREHARSPHPEHFADGYGVGLNNNVRYAVRARPGTPGKTASRAQRFAAALANDMPDIVKLGHDSGTPEVVYHCPFCGSGQVIARSDGTIECGFCKTCFTVQVQPQYPAFPQTINGMPIQVPGMGPQWPGQEDDPEAQQAQQAAIGTPVDEEEGDGNPFAEDAGDEEDEDLDDEADEPSGNPFAKKSFRTASGAPVPLPSFLRHVALESARDRDRMLSKIRKGSR